MSKILTILLVLVPFFGFTQADWENPKGAIKSEEIIIEKDKQLTLPTVSRRFTSIITAPLAIDTVAIKYVPKNIALELPKIPVKLRPRTMKSEALDKTYWGNFKVGFGSYISPFLQADVASKRNDEYAVAAHFRHFSSKNGPVDGNNSGQSNTDGYLSGKIFLNKVTLGANAGAQFDKYHLYGYDRNNPVPEAQNIEQNLTNYTLNFSVIDNDSNKDFYYEVKFGGQFFNAKDLTWSENDYNINLRSDIKLQDALKIKILGDFHIATQNSVNTSKSRMYFMFKPIATYSIDALDFEVGTGIFGTQDPINNYSSKVYITPHLVARYHLVSGQKISAGVKGDVTWQSARTLFSANPYLGAAAVVNNQVKPIEFFLEATGKLASKIDFKLGYKASVYKVFGQFINNALEQSTFYIDYLQDNNLVHTLNGQIDFVASKNLLFSGYGKYLMFNLKNIENLYHVPTVNIGLKARFNLENKFSTELSLAYLDGIYAYDNITASEVRLNSILDLNISSSYKINSIFSAFVKMQNLIGNKYQYFYNYPSRGFQALAGLSITL